MLQYHRNTSRSVEVVASMRSKKELIWELTWELLCYSDRWGQPFVLSVSSGNMEINSSEVYTFEKHGYIPDGNSRGCWAGWLNGLQWEVDDCGEREAAFWSESGFCYCFRYFDTSISLFLKENQLQLRKKSRLAEFLYWDATIPSFHDKFILQTTLAKIAKYEFISLVLCISQEIFTVS